MIATCNRVVYRFEPSIAKIAACFVAVMLQISIGVQPAAAQPGETFKTPPNQRSLPVGSERAFPEILFRRPLVVTHAGDGSNRVFVAEQYGSIKVFKNDPEVQDTETFLNIESKVEYKDEENEEGLLGLAFHPNYKLNGEFFVFYTTNDAEYTQVISRFRRSKVAPNEADPLSEEVLMKIGPKPLWNHNGGTLVFGPDGYLYIALGDGGKANDIPGNGQNTKTLLGSILRIDVDKKDNGKAYAIPKDNPFKDGKNGLPEIYAYGLRNVWRMAFDRPTGLLYAADVGQNVWEEINIIEKGGNYGWNVREGMHLFNPRNGEAGPKDTPAKGFIDPIYEYHHDYGKSITGGAVYRGKKIPELVGKYVYADYVSGALWALDYNPRTGKVDMNYGLQSDGLPVMSFGEDEEGELYYTVPSGHMFKLVSAK